MKNVDLYDSGLLFSISSEAQHQSILGLYTLLNLPWALRFQLSLHHLHLAFVIVWVLFYLRLLLCFLGVLVSPITASSDCLLRPWIFAVSLVSCSLLGVTNCRYPRIDISSIPSLVIVWANCIFGLIFHLFLPLAYAHGFLV